MVMSLVSQILGLDNDIHINEVVLGFLLSISSIDPESHSIHCFNLDEYPAEVIHVQLSNSLKSGFLDISHTY